MPGTLLHLPRAARGCSTLPEQTCSFRGTHTASSCQGRCQQLPSSEVPMEHSPTAQTWCRENHLTNTALASGAQAGHNCAFLCWYIQDCYTPIENLSTFTCSSSFLQGYGIKYQNRSLPEKTLHLHSNSSECGLQKYLSFFFHVLRNLLLI